MGARREGSRARFCLSGCPFSNTHEMELPEFLSVTWSASSNS